MPNSKTLLRATKDKLAELSTYYFGLDRSHLSHAQILEQILFKSTEVIQCDGAALFLFDKSNKTLVPQCIINHSLDNLRIEDFPVIKLSRPSLASECFLDQKNINIPDAYKISDASPRKMDQSFDQKFDYYTKSIFCLPLLSPSGNCLGVLEFVNKKNLLLSKWNKKLAQKKTPSFGKPDEDVFNMVVRMLTLSLEEQAHQEQDKNNAEVLLNILQKYFLQEDPTYLIKTKKLNGHIRSLYKLILKSSAYAAYTHHSFLQSVQLCAAFIPLAKTLSPGKDSKTQAFAAYHELKDFKGSKDRGGIAQKLFSFYKLQSEAQRLNAQNNEENISLSSKLLSLAVDIATLEESKLNSKEKEQKLLEIYKVYGHFGHELKKLYLDQSKSKKAA